jgi:hypothetical protein
MKKIVTLLVLVAASVFVYAQKKISVTESSMSFAEGKQNALIVNIYEASEDLIQKEWKRLMKDFGAKVNVKKEIFADDATIKGVSDNTIDVYAYTEKNTDGDFNLVVGFNLGGAYLSSSAHSAQYKKAESILYEFAVETTREAIKEVISSEERILSKLQKDQSDLEKNKERLLKDIEDYKKKIQTAEEDIKTNEKDQVNKKGEIEKQEGLVKKLNERKEAVK